MKPKRKPLDKPTAAEDYDLENLLSRTIEILRREITHLMVKSASSKLDYNEARDLVQYIKLLTDLDEKQKEALQNLSDEELEKLSHEGVKVQDESRPQVVRKRAAEAKEGERSKEVPTDRLPLR